jgi:hypothetical protein
MVTFPDRGHKRPDLTSRPLRFTLVGDYLIAYAPEENHCGLSLPCTDAAIRESWRQFCEVENSVSENIRPATPRSSEPPERP